MDGVGIATCVLTLAAGVGVFLVACNVLGGSIRALGGDRLKTLIAATSKNKLAGVGAGAVVTAAIQSSSATSVTVIGLVNAGMMSLFSAAAVIFGANIGTTVTGFFVALGMGGGSVSLSLVFSAFAGVGAFVLAFAKGERAANIGGAIAGFGMLFVGLSLMSGAVAFVAESETVRGFIASFEDRLLLVAAGALLTAVVQSSSVVTSMVITSAASGLLSLNQGIYLIMGSNVGTCVTALLAGASTKNGRRVALLHLFFNVSGVFLFFVAGLVMRACGTDYGMLFALLFPRAPKLRLPFFHTVFNVVTVAAILPFSDKLISLVIKLVPDGAEKNRRREVV